MSKNKYFFIFHFFPYGVRCNGKFWSNTHHIQLYNVIIYDLHKKCYEYVEKSVQKRRSLNLKESNIKIQNTEATNKIGQISGQI